MSKTIICEGKTSTEAIEIGLKQLNVSKNQVDIKILENEDKRSFFSILTPRVVKVELTLKENVKEKIKEKEPKKIIEREYNENPEEIEAGKERVKDFLKTFLKEIGELEYTIKVTENTIIVNLLGNNAGKLIGYRGETLNSLQIILSSIANKKATKKIRLSLDIEGYRARREKTLQELATKISKTVLKTGKSVTLEPMSAYERKIIHTALQDNKNITTYSIGENEGRRVVVEKVK